MEVDDAAVNAAAALLEDRLLGLVVGAQVLDDGGVLADVVVACRVPGDVREVRTVDLGLAAISGELARGPAFDLLAPGVLNLLLGWMRSGLVRAVWLGTPCSSFSPARKGRPGDPGGPLRTRPQPWGLAGLPQKDRDNARYCNSSACLRSI